MLYVDDKINIVYNIHILGEVGVFDIKTLEMIEGDFPPKVNHLSGNGRKNTKMIC